MNYLVVVAHPDDEVLGAGGTIKRLTAEGNTVDLCIMSGEAKARAFRPEDSQLREDLESCAGFLGINKIYTGSFPNIEMNTVPHLQLVQFIEKAIEESGARIIITHHFSDTNNDHCQTSLACQAAIRLFQRRTDVPAFRELWYMEVPSSTEWSVNTSLESFKPNVFVEIGADGVENKIKGLAMYRGVMRPYPHPRSREALGGLAAYRGSQSGCDYAEAFECAFRRVELCKN